MINLITSCREEDTLFRSLKYYFSVMTLALLLLNSSVRRSLAQDVPVLNPPKQENVEQLPQKRSAFDEPANPRDPAKSPQEKDNLQILMRGPMHEAFAELHSADPKPNAIVKKQPPKPIEEIPPQFKPEGTNVIWIPGYWAWDLDKKDFVWVSGLWRDAPERQNWIPGYWQKVDEGHRWISGFWSEKKSQEVEYLPTLPPKSLDVGPSTRPPSDNHFYSPGNWVYRDNAYQWQPGCWRPLIENWVWIPARYVWTPHGCVFRPGYWDHIVENRGVCFAPVYFQQPIYQQTTFSYTPTCAIDLCEDFLVHLFVDFNQGHYCYGDWYSNNFVQQGIYPWVNVHRHRNRFYDPLLAYYTCPTRRYQNVNTYQWIFAQHNHYRQHVDLRPRPTFHAQINFNKNYRGRHRDLARRSGFALDINQWAQRSRNRGGNSREFQNSRSRNYRKLTKIDSNEIRRIRNATKPILTARNDRQKRERPGRQPKIDLNRNTRPGTTRPGNPPPPVVGNRGKNGTTPFVPRQPGVNRGSNNPIVNNSRNDRKISQRERDWLKRQNDGDQRRLEQTRQKQLAEIQRRARQRQGNGNLDQNRRTANKPETPSNRSDRLQRQNEQLRRQRKKQQRERDLNQIANQQRERQRTLQNQRNITERQSRDIQRQRDNEQIRLRQQQSEIERKRRFEQQNRMRQEQFRKAQEEQRRRADAARKAQEARDRQQRQQRERQQRQGRNQNRQPSKLSIILPEEARKLQRRRAEEARKIQEARDRQQQMQQNRQRLADQQNRVRQEQFRKAQEEQRRRADSARKAQEARDRQMRQQQDRKRQFDLNRVRQEQFRKAQEEQRRRADSARRAQEARDQQQRMAQARGRQQQMERERRRQLDQQNRVRQEQARRAQQEQARRAQQEQRRRAEAARKANEARERQRRSEAAKRAEQQRRRQAEERSRSNSQRQRKNQSGKRRRR